MPPTEGLTDGKAAIPLYQQVIDIIKNEINSGAYKAGARIPNEFELAESELQSSSGCLPEKNLKLISNWIG